MEDIKTTWQKIIADTLNGIAPETCDKILPEQINIETPPNPEMGDVAFPLFTFAKSFKSSPAKIASDVCARLLENEDIKKYGMPKAIGPYLNVFLAKGDLASNVLDKVLKEKENYGKTSSLSGKRIMIEFSSPNTNKPLHLGHLRNDALGESISRILKFCGADVFKVNIINDRGVHICKSMIAYQKFGEGKTPESENIKSDRFVGDMYVAFHKYSQENPEKAEAEAKQMLLDWEAGENKELIGLWKKMNGWAIEGIKETYKRTGISFDKLYFESETYLKGKDQILKGLEAGVFYKEEDGSVWVDLAPIKLDKKVLLRSDGTSLYMTQDIGTAISRHKDWPFNQMIYVVGNEQEYHFKVLFYVLKQLGFEWADDLYHLSYGMVNLPEGKMKSREGTVVDADDLINSLQDEALKKIEENGREKEVGDAAVAAENIAVGALHYFLLQVSPKKDMLFNPKESLSFTGNTGPYLQYMGARISSILRKAETAEGKEKLKDGKLNASLLTNESEWELLKTLEDFPEQVARSALRKDPSALTAYLYELSKAFSRFYRDCPILSGDDADLSYTRMELARATKIVLQNAMNLVLIPFMEIM
ncbi:arginine--tRNA ligase [Treponema denticola]|uniref:arginine--tRNA ligase n=1 Tax=Treponema denticola TaxID=158 RepID=UPI0020A34591|nr:arginine--tRNA ligase [Treponema denticola]UTD08026.1 arginine--tRNA ligase [Treponema denticola]